MIDKLQSLKGKTKLKIYKNISNSYTEMKKKTFKLNKILFSKNAQVVSKIYHEVLLIMIFLQTKPQIKNMNNNYYVLFYTVIKNRDDKDIIDENNENDYIDFIDFITLNHYIGIKPHGTIIK